MKNLVKLLSILFAVIFVGCVSVPKTDITGDIKSGKFHYKSPKDADIGYLKIVANTNGSVTVEMRKVSGVNNPEVIASSADGQVAIIKAMAEGFGQVAGAAAKAAAKP